MKTSVLPAACDLSIIIKALNEAANIERTITKVLEAAQGLSAQIILADSLSDDATVQLASQFPIEIVQLLDKKDRSCGVGAQLGFQYARGRLILLLDGDMELQRAWLLAAMQRLEEVPALGGVGGLIEDMNFDNIEFRARRVRAPKDLQAGEVDRLNGGGLFKRAAIESIGYFTNRNLHSCEELELALRLSAAGWRMERLGLVAVRHYGHTDALWSLVRKRWRSGYVNGAGELLRASIGQPWFAHALRGVYKLIAVFFWLLLSLLIFGFVAGGLLPWWVFAISVATPAVLMIGKKRSLSLGLYAVLAWCVDLGGLLRGVFTRPRNPSEPVASRIVRA